MKRILIFTIVLISSIAGCKKDSTQQNATRDKLLGKWTYVSTIANDFYSGSDHIMTINGNSGDYVDFRTDGKVYTYTQGSADTTGYGIISDSKLWIDNASDTFNINTLTNSNAKLYRKENVTSSEYTEVTITLAK